MVLQENSATDWMPHDGPDPAGLDATQEAGREAAALLHAGAPDAAGRLLADALARAPGDIGLAATYAGTLLRLGRAAEALPHLLGTLESAPAEPTLWRLLAEALVEVEAFVPARQALAQAVAFGLPHAAAGALETLLRFREERGLRPPQAEAAMTTQGVAATQPATPAVPVELVVESRAMLGMYEKHLYAEVADRARAAIARWPDHVAGHEFLASALEAERRFGDAIEPARRVVALLPDDVGARLRLDRLVAVRSAARPGGTVRSHDRLGLRGLPPEAEPAREILLRASRLQVQGRLDNALAAYAEADALVPGIAEIKLNKAAMLQALGRLPEASDALEEAAALSPASLYIRQMQAGLLIDRARYGDAAEVCKAALALDPEDGQLLLALATAQRALGLLADAEAAARLAIASGERTGIAYATLGHVLQLQGRVEDARGLFREAISVDPDNLLAGSGLLFCEVHSGDCGPAEAFALHRAFGERAEACVVPLRHDPALRRHAGPPRIGFLSGDLRSHAVAHFIEPFLRELATRGFELLAYMAGPQEDGLSRALRPLFRGWTNVHALNDTDLALRIADDRVDILFDLSGHTAYSRLPVFAARAAPVQVSWIGYPGTTGLARMDYFICNPVLAPDAAMDAQFTEALVRLPFSTVFTPLRNNPPVAPLPALAARTITFGSLNRLSKVTPVAYDLWARILHRVPTARLLVAAIPDAAAQARVIAEFSARGIGADRLLPRLRCDFESYLRLHDEVDVMLDTFPYAGGTSTCFAAWMGVPTITLAGDVMHARVGASILAHLGLHDCIAETPDAYVDRAIAWAGRIDALAGLRAALRDRVRDRLSDPRRVVDGLEVALHTMWQSWCHGLPPEPFSVGLEDGSILDPLPAAPPTRAVA